MLKQKKLKTRVLSVALTLAMVITMLPMTAFAGDSAGTISVVAQFENLELDFSGESLEQIFNGDEAKVYELKITAGEVKEADWLHLKKFTKLTAFEIADEVTVANIPDGKYSDTIFPKTIESAIVPQAITIGDYVFSNCTVLADATFPKATAIGAEAFHGCQALRTITLPNVTSMGNFAFRYCSSLATLKLGAVPPTLEDEVFLECPATHALGYVDAEGSDLTGDALTNAQAAYGSVTTAGAVVDGKWYGWTIAAAPISVTIKANGVEKELSGGSLAEALKNDVTGTTEIKVTAGKVTKDDWEYLKQYRNLEKFEIADGVTVANIPAVVNSEEDKDRSIFPKTILSVTVPQEITVGNYAFRNCANLTDISLLKAQTISMSAFENCTRLTTATLPGANYISIGAFEGCANLTTLKLGATPPTVDAYVFDGCPATRALGYVGANGIDLIGKALTDAQAAYKAVDDSKMSGEAAGNGTWYGWAIEEAPISATVTAGGETRAYSGESLKTLIRNNSLNSSDVTEVKITAGKVTVDDWEYLFYLNNLKNFEIAETIGDGKVANIPSVESNFRTFPATIVSVTVPQAITIGDYAFKECFNLTTANFPKATAIGKGAFRLDQRLETGAFPQATTVGEEAFLTCTGLTSVAMPKVMEIGKNAFRSCGSLATLKLGATPPSILGADTFNGGPATRALGYVGANGSDLTGKALTDAQAAYKAVNDGQMSGEAAGNDTWYGWAIVPTTYAVTINEDGGTGASGGGSYAAGATVTLTAGEKSGSYSFGSWSLSGATATGTSGKSVTFAMPANAVTAQINWTYTGSSGNDDSFTPSTPTTPDSSVTVDGKPVNIGKTENTASTTTVVVDSTKLDSVVGTAKDGSSVTIPVTTSKGSAAAQLIMESMGKMAAKDITLEVKAGKTTYALPTGAIDAGSILAQLGATDPAKVPFTITITNEKSTQVEGATLVAPPVSFQITATYNGKTTTVDSFTTMVARTIEITKEQAQKTTTGVVVENGKIIRHVPTYVYEQNGKYYARMNSMTNSIYAIITSESAFTDTAGQWYGAAANELSAREICKDIYTTVFEGDKAITRAEFAALLVNALGLPREQGASFTDVSPDAWYSQFVATANRYEIIKGIGNNLFAPDAMITRQEAMVMMERAAQIMGYTGQTGELNAFADVADVGAWAIGGVKFSVGSGLIVGDGNKLMPRDSITRGETATVVLRLLQQAELVDVRAKT